jgi:hypothetical protein
MVNGADFSILHHTPGFIRRVLNISGFRTLVQLRVDHIQIVLRVDKREGTAST